ncbi:MAG: GNAT family N-acetyltransferase, partial [Myxococcales bacterium]|nr:GNAT family N-acetyltransferase [Myxococcales bacterium]
MAEADSKAKRTGSVDVREMEIGDLAPVFELGE